MKYQNPFVRPRQSKTAQGAKRLLLLVLLVIVGLSLASSTGAAPYVLRYQGRLMDSDGNPLDGTYSVTFRLYHPSVGSPVWSATLSTDADNGMFHALLGRDPGNPLNPSIFQNGYVFIAVEVGGYELSRERMVSSPYAIHASDADLADAAHETASLQGLTPSDLAAESHTHPEYQVWSQGEGGGLDADMLDGHHRSEFSASDHDHTGDYAPLDHMHTSADISPQGAAGALQGDYLDGENYTAFAEDVHTHDAGEVTAGTFSVDRFDAYNDLSVSGRLNGDNDADLLMRGSADGKYAAFEHDVGDQAIFSFITFLSGSFTPVAHGTIYASGTGSYSGSGNYTVTWNATYDRYEITISGHTYHYLNYTTIVTDASGSYLSPQAVTTGSTGGKLLVYIREHE